MSVGHRHTTVTVREGIRPPWRYRQETITWKATGRPAMTHLKARNRRRNRIAKASRKANRP